MTIDKNILTYEEQAVFTLRSLYSQYGYERYKMSRFEEYDLYVRNKDFLVSDDVITFTDRTGRLMALKPDVTLSIIKNTTYLKGQVQKLYYDENVYRVPEGSNSFKEIMQAGLECVGDLEPKDIAEVVVLAAKSLKLLSTKFVLDVSHMGLVSALLESSGLPQSAKKSALRCMTEKNAHELSALCKAEDADATKLLAVMNAVGTPEAVLPQLKGILSTEDELKAYDELSQMCEILKNTGHGESVQLDFSVCNNLKYYSGVVFKGYVDGIPTGILSGGQYDALLKKMGNPSKAIGFAIYVDMLQDMERVQANKDYLEGLIGEING